MYHHKISEHRTKVEIYSEYEKLYDLVYKLLNDIKVHSLGSLINLEKEVLNAYRVIHDVKQVEDVKNIDEIERQIKSTHSYIKGRLNDIIETL